ncbi:MAG: metalloregulator ArsR/SmtB family transcription factor [bacterium]
MARRMEEFREEQIDTCDTDAVDVEKVRAVREELPEEEVLQDLAETFRTLADGSRVKILFALARQELCVHDLALLLDVSSSAVSHQLSTLRRMRLVRSRRDGRMVYYHLDDDHIEKLFVAGLEHVEEER